MKSSRLWKELIFGLNFNGYPSCAEHDAYTGLRNHWGWIKLNELEECIHSIVVYGAKWMNKLILCLVITQSATTKWRNNVLSDKLFGCIHLYLALSYHLLSAPSLIIYYNKTEDWRVSMGSGGLNIEHWML